MERMREEGDFQRIEPIFFSTSNVGGAGPAEAGRATLQDAGDVEKLSVCDVLISCQGGAYTSRAYPMLRSAGWKGYWIDSASTLRLDPEATLVLDPVNGSHLLERIENGSRTFVGANCTVSLLLMAVGGLFKANVVEWITTMTYQAASGAGSRPVTELAHQIQSIHDLGSPSKSSTSLEITKAVVDAQRSHSLPTEEIGAPLACNVLPWIDRAMEDGQTREEWKASVEAKRILNTDHPVLIDGICCRVDAQRCHSQALCIKLVEDMPLEQIEDLIRSSSDWARVIENSKEASLKALTPAAVSGTLDIPVGRVRKLQIGSAYVGAFTVGDQLLWGAAEPLRRMLCILESHAGI